MKSRLISRNNIFGWNIKLNIMHLGEYKTTAGSHDLDISFYFFSHLFRGTIIERPLSVYSAAPERDSSRR